MKLELELDDNIYQKLLAKAEEVGITVPELVRVIIGDSTIRRADPQKYMEQMTRFMKLFPRLLMAGEAIKCSACTLPLTMEAIEQGKCLNCGAEI